MAKIPDLFFSYAWGDNKYNQKKVIYLKEFLEKNYHYKIWLDIDHISVGQQLFGEIEEGMRNAKAVVVILTNDYPLSANCRKEIALADALGKPLIPLMFEEVPWPPTGLGMYLAGSVYLKFETHSIADENSGVVRSDFWNQQIMEKLRLQIREHVKDPEENATQEKTDEIGSNLTSIGGTEKNGTITSNTWSYTGDVKNKMPHGRGTKTWKSGVLHYGEWKNGQAHGAGIRIWNDGGGQFSGDWSNGAWIYGTYSWPDGGRYVGEFYNYKRHGDGIFKYHNGDRYVGGWKEDIKHGWGIYTYKMGTQYSGDYHENKKHGVGKMKYENGDIYEGGWQNNKKHGKGFYAYKAENNSYDGDWVDDYKEGFGVFVYGFGDKYEGHWVKSKRHGKGTYWFNNGDIYDGDWDMDIKQGYGKYTYGGQRLGDIYVGAWVKGKKHGHGKYTYADGRFYEGEWNMNSRLGELQPTSENPDFKNGVRINSIAHSQPPPAYSQSIQQSQVKSARMLTNSQQKPAFNAELIAPALAAQITNSVNKTNAPPQTASVVEHSSGRHSAPVEVNSNRLPKKKDNQNQRSEGCILM